MSQKKVDSYKAGKNNRSRTAKKEKLIDRLEILAWPWLHGSDIPPMQK